MTDQPLFQMRGVSLSFGGLKAVVDFDLALPRGVLHGLIGPNGAGKTTVFNLITGVHQADRGKIQLASRSLAGMKPNRIAAAGIARTFQNIRIFGELTVLDNVRVGCHVRASHSFTQALLRSPRHTRGEKEIDDQAHRILEIFHLQQYMHEPARSLPYGEQRRLEIARALATRPRLLLLDEPAAGTHPGEKAELARLIQSIRRDFDLTILLIEHDMSVVMRLCDHITVLNHGQVIACDTPEQIRNDPDVVEAYLGEPAPKGEDI